MRVVVVIIFFLNTLTAFSQETNAEKEKEKEKEKKTSLEVDGMVALATDLEKIYFTLGGPSLRLKIKKDFAVGLSAFPKLVFSEEPVEPKLGCGFRIDLKKILLVTPSYYDSKTKTWKWAAGIGYRF